MAALLFRCLKSVLAIAVISATLSACAGPGGSRALSGESRATTQGSAWKMIWNDEFDTGAIDPAKWKPEVNCFGGGNNEAQCYTQRRENAFVDNDGKLHLIAREEIYSGPALTDDDPQYDIDDTSATRSYTSGRIRTMGLFDFKYGRVEVRAMLPAGFCRSRVKQLASA